MIYRLLLLALLCSLAGCQVLVPVHLDERPPVALQPTRTAQGLPTVTIQTSLDYSIITIRAEQTYRTTSGRQIRTTEAVRRYLGWPLAPLSGLLQCPIGTLAAAVSDGIGVQTMRQVGCLRLLGFEPLRQVADRHTVDTIDTETTNERGPAPGLVVEFHPEDGTHDIIREVTGTDGVAQIKGYKLSASSPSTVFGTLRVVYNGEPLLVENQNLTHSVSRNPLPESPPKHSPAQDRRVVRIDATTDPLMHGWLIKTMIDAGLPVIGTARHIDLVIAEQREQMTQPYSDQHKVAAGRLNSPDLILSGARLSKGQDPLITMTILTTRSAEVRTLEEQDWETLGRRVLDQILRPENNGLVIRKGGHEK